MSDTPLTDEIGAQPSNSAHTDYLAMREHARALERRNAKLREALLFALKHIKELREAFMTGALSCNDGSGGTRPNRNVEAEVMARAALKEDE